MGQRSDADFMVEELDEETKAKAMRTVAQTAVRLGADTADTRQVLMLLGLIDTPAPASKPEAAPKKRIATSIPADRAQLRLRDLRKVTTLAAIARDTGISRAALSDIANGVILRVTPETERKILAVTGVGRAGAA